MSRRAINLAGAAACAGMMGFALYVQHGLGLEPCPLCVLQRIATISLGLVFLVAAGTLVALGTIPVFFIVLFLVLVWHLVGLCDKSHIEYIFNIEYLSNHEIFLIIISFYIWYS